MTDKKQKEYKTKWNKLKDKMNKERKRNENSN